MKNIMKKSRIISLIFAIALIASAFCGCKAKSNEPAAQQDERFRVTSYVIADRVKERESICDEDFDIITDVILFGCVTFNENGELDVNKDDMTVALSNLKDAIGERDVNIYINALGPASQSDSGDWNEQMADLAERHSKAFGKKQLISNLTSLVNDNGFDGLFFDYEYPIENKAWKAFSRFLVKIDDALGDKKLGVALSNWDLNLSKKAMQAVDFVEMMLYDCYDDSGRHSTFDTSTEIVNSFIEHGYDKKKLDFGVPFYARPTDKDAFWYSYRDFYKQLDENGMCHINEDSKDAYFNSPEVIAQKTRYALDNGYGGMMIWHYTCDLPSTDENSCLRAMGEEINIKA